ncbi:hypothetical protein B7463_g9565, partial [Scytalidium lignicola]
MVRFSAAEQAESAPSLGLSGMNQWDGKALCSYHTQFRPSSAPGYFFPVLSPLCSTLSASTGLFRAHALPMPPLNWSWFAGHVHERGALACGLLTVVWKAARPLWTRSGPFPRDFSRDESCHAGN